MFGRRKKKSKPVLFDQFAGEGPSLHSLCDAVASHPDSVIVAVFDRHDFDDRNLDPSLINHEDLQWAIYDLVMGEAWEANA